MGKVAGGWGAVSYREGLGRILGLLAGLVGRRITLAILLQHWVNVLKGQIEVFSLLCPCTARLLIMLLHRPVFVKICSQLTHIDLLGADDSHAAGVLMGRP